MPALECAIFSARARKLPLHVVPASVALPSATDTDKPNGAMATLICSTSAVSLRTVTMQIPSQKIITKDNVSIDIAAVAYYHISDPEKAVIVIENV